MATGKGREQELGEVAGRVVRVAYDVITKNLDRGRKAAAAIARGERSKLDERTARSSSDGAAAEVHELGEAGARFMQEAFLAAYRFSNAFLESANYGEKEQPREPFDRAAGLFLEGVA